MTPRNVFVNVPSQTDKVVCVWNGSSMEAFSGAREFGEPYLKLPGTEVYVFAHEIRTSRKPESIESMLAVLDLEYVDQDIHTLLRERADSAYAELDAYKGVINKHLRDYCTSWCFNALPIRDQLDDIIKRELSAPNTDLVIAAIREIITNVVLHNTPKLPTYEMALPAQIAAISRIANVDY